MYIYILFIRIYMYIYIGVEKLGTVTSPVLARNFARKFPCFRIRIYMYIYIYIYMYIVTSLLHIHTHKFSGIGTRVRGESV